MVIATVRFAPGARTAWHSHEKGQYLRITAGVGRFGTSDGQTEGAVRARAVPPVRQLVAPTARRPRRRRSALERVPVGGR